MKISTQCIFLVILVIALAACGKKGDINPPSDYSAPAPETTSLSKPVSIQ